jgi:hypothetical protein
MRLSKSVLFTALLSLLFISSANSHSTKQVDNWLEFCPNIQLCFDRPTSLQPADVQMIDSLAGQLENEHLTLYYDLGLYSSTFTELTSAVKKPVVVNGHKGTILIVKNKMALTIPHVSDNMRFSMLIEFKGSLQREKGERIFNSIKFNL